MLLRRIRAMLVFAVLWGVLWSVLATVIGGGWLLVKHAPFPFATMEIVRILATTFGIAGGLGGALFGLGLMGASREHAVSRLRMPRTVAAGVAAGVVFPLIVAVLSLALGNRSDGLSFIAIAGIGAVTGGLTAGVTLQLARRAPEEEREFLAAHGVASLPPASGNR